ncbi:Hypothetical predicted protein [Pelobates cultripes]|uniref:NUP210 Ig-like domain-containing protein n=1 Tax=Pelobates cultripes TaxID=61616 RepID=A0AAD1T2B3_PELCU|nr:Hypothetical predicted protein [Pelobates cultripes]
MVAENTTLEQSLLPHHMLHQATVKHLDGILNCFWERLWERQQAARPAQPTLQIKGKQGREQREHSTLAHVTTSLELLLVEDIQVNTHTICIYNHPLVTATFTIGKGSGYFYINSSVSNIAGTAFQDKKRTVVVFPLHSGTVTVMVYDLCLALPEPVKVNVHVSDIFHVDVTVVDKVEIGKNIKAYVRVLDSARKPFMVQYLAYMNLELTSSSHVVSIK